ncbi:NUDIX domain-containing protein [uncultured Thermomonospora sp.]|uniref:NUDIX domain-containing protein n=1 Tax=uncultured Thermomonospora sp. TaxID=671175 RepID=UPI00259BB957|nr:NUDIX domain-containing protein [uncultured Thermomonospora sp.]
MTVLGIPPVKPHGAKWAWGENRTVDPVVLATVDGRRYLLMVRRRDTGTWALPGGFRQPGEDPVAAATRELAEETGLNLQAFPHLQPAPQRDRLVHDPRCTPWAWIVTTPVAVVLGELDRLPQVSGSSDAAEAKWLPAGTYCELAAAADANGSLYEPHRRMLADLLA